MGRFDAFRKLLRPLGALAGVTGAAAAINLGLRETSGLPVDYIGGTRRLWKWRGFDIYATEQGEGPTVLLVHGIYAGASSFEFRKLVPLLARRHRVIAFDMIGCGLSDMPDLDYTAETFVEHIVDALAEFASAPATLIASSLGAAFAIRAAMRASGRAERLVTICPTGLCGVLDKEPVAAQRAISALIRSPLAGESFFNALASPPSLRWFLTNQSYADPASATPEVIDQYYAITHRPGARFVPAQFVGGNLNCNVARDLPFLSQPLLVMWGDRASRTNPMENAQEFLRLAPSATLATFAHSGLLPHEEEPDESAVAIEEFVAATTGVH